QGFYASIDLQQTLKPGSFSYFRVNPEVRVYAPATRYAVLAMRAIYGGLFPENGSGPEFSPFTQRFFFGGQNDQRGYAPLRQGPKYGAVPICDATQPPWLVPCTPYATVAVPRGGNAAALVSAELRIHADWLLNHLGIVTFVDASSVGDDPKRPIGVGLEVAVGLGLRYITPFGPIRFDVGWLLNPRDIVTDPVFGTDPSGNRIVVVQPTRVSSHCPDNTPGCIKETRWAFHITLGEAF
ncbi:MAG TPA: BamA/TamA family outer membrane protein, partial [Myxococcales bacterium]